MMSKFAIARLAISPLAAAVLSDIDKRTRTDAIKLGIMNAGDKR
jgi:hypothetical protein